MDLLVKTKLVLQQTPGVFVINDDFKNPKVVIDINVPIKSEAAEDDAAAEESALTDRVMIVQVLCRVQKKRKDIHPHVFYLRGGVLSSCIPTTSFLFFFSRPWSGL
jgi:hypothetical protein